MRNETVAVLALFLGACVSGGEEPPPLPKLAQDQGAPELALLEHVLTGYFASTGASPPTTCASLRPTALTDRQEKALIARFVRLAPGERCAAASEGAVDSVTGKPAVIVEAYDFFCRRTDACVAWVTVPGTPSTHYAMRYENGEWRFTSDRRLLAE